LAASAVAFVGPILSFLLVRSRDFRRHELEQTVEEPALELGA
jgi:hypothetical protein